MIREICDKAGALMIVDEIQCGFGRTGKMWAIEHYGVTPDIVVWGKGVGGDQPLTGRQGRHASTTTCSTAARSRRPSWATRSRARSA